MANLLKKIDSTHFKGWVKKSGKNLLAFFGGIEDTTNSFWDFLTFFQRPYVLNLSFKSDVDAVKYGLVNIRQFQIHQGLVSKEVSNCGNRLSTLDQVPIDKKLPKITCKRKFVKLTSHTYTCNNLTSFIYVCVQHIHSYHRKRKWWCKSAEIDFEKFVKSH